MCKSTKIGFSSLSKQTLCPLYHLCGQQPISNWILIDFMTVSWHCSIFNLSGISLQPLYLRLAQVRPLYDALDILYKTITVTPAHFTLESTPFYITVLIMETLVLCLSNLPCQSCMWHRNNNKQVCRVIFRNRGKWERRSKRKWVRDARCLSTWLYSRTAWPKSLLQSYRKFAF